MANQTIKIQGTIINAKRQPLSNLFIEVRDKDVLVDELVAIQSIT